jgi:plastocyanin
MNSRTKTVLALVALLLSVAITIMPVLTARLFADTSYLPLVANRTGNGTNTPTLVPTQPNEYGTPTASATVVVATATGTQTATATVPTATSTGTNTPTATEAAATATATATELPGSTTVTVTVASNSFSPSSVQINPGDTVVWVRTSGFHNVLADDNSFRLGEPLSGNPSNTWTTVSHTFTQTGTIPYHCEVHGFGMAGTVVVGSGQ